MQAVLCKQRLFKENKDFTAPWTASSSKWEHHLRAARSTVAAEPPLHGSAWPSVSRKNLWLQCRLSSRNQTPGQSRDPRNGHEYAHGNAPPWGLMLSQLRLVLTAQQHRGEKGGEAWPLLRTLCYHQHLCSRYMFSIPCTAQNANTKWSARVGNAPDQKHYAPSAASQHLRCWPKRGHHLIGRGKPEISTPLSHLRAPLVLFALCRLVCLL